MVRTVGISVGSRGAFDWTWKPSGNATRSASLAGAAGSLAIGRGDRRNLGSRPLHLGIANGTGAHHSCEGEPGADMKSVLPSSPE